jgi:putative chitinase
MTALVSEAQLKQLLPNNPHTGYWWAVLFGPQEELGGSSLLNAYDINTPKRVAAFIAQCAHESGGLMVLQENLNYRAATLRTVFPKYFPTDAIAADYANRPNKQEAIANRVYANRMGNGDESSGDGFRFRGRGLIQLTGRSNYQAFAKSLGVEVDEVPEYLATFEGAAQSACWFWDKNNLNQWADQSDIITLTKRINGGTIGLEDRLHHYKQALAVIGANGKAAPVRATAPVRKKLEGTKVPR